MSPWADTAWACAKLARVRWAVRVFFSSLLLIAALAPAAAQKPTVDTDRDGIPDVEEGILLHQFLPRFMISAHDCSSRPAEFTPLLRKPVVAAENGVIYGQASPRAGQPNEMELHYYDLWRRDCGESGHDLDAEHVSVLIGRDSSGTWKARYWYAAAHEDTWCDASQIAQATAVDGESRGPEVWISGGKHAAFLAKKICSKGCGADRCEAMEELPVSNLINLGEFSAPMNGASWVDSPQWPLADKIGRSDFGAERLRRLDRMPADDIVWASPGKRPAEAAILGGNDAIAAVGLGLRATDGALTSADTKTGNALNTASGKSGNALARAYRGVKDALRATMRAAGGK